MQARFYNLSINLTSSDFSMDPINTCVIRQRRNITIDRKERFIYLRRKNLEDIFAQTECMCGFQERV